MKTHPGPQARQKKGWWRTYRWLVLRRVCQILVLMLFLLGPLIGVWIIKGNLASSLILDVVPMTDLLIFAQIVVAQGIPSMQAVWGFLLVMGLYLLLGGRLFCAWVCPVNLVTDGASWLRGRLGITGGWRGNRRIRYWLLLLVLILAALSQTLVWEWINPMAMLHRSLIFGLWMGLFVVVGIFLFDLLVSPHGWCGRLCPTGAMYSLLSVLAMLRVDAHRRDACTDCMDCYLVCPEPQVIDPALKGASRGLGSIIKSIQCTNCGRCIDVCPEEVYRFDFYFPNKSRVTL